MPTVKFHFENKEVEVGEHANLRRVAQLNKVQLYEGPAKLLNCHGLGFCSTCVVEILEGMENLSPPSFWEKLWLRGYSPTLRLSCQTDIEKGSVTIITNPKV